MCMMKQLMKWLTPVLMVALVFSGCGDKKQETKTLQVAWAQWAPADYLQQLSQDFTAETGIDVKVVQIPWEAFQTKIDAAFIGKSTLYDIVIGDSQWLGRNSTAGHYLDLTDWINQNIDVKTIAPLAMKAFAEYGGKYWALPAEVDAAGFAYRKDLFEDPKEQAEFKAQYGYELAVPKTLNELRDIAAFFTRPEQDLYGLAAWFSKTYDGVTMGFQQVMWSYGGSYGDPTTHRVKGYLNSPESVEALKFYKELFQYAPKNAADYYWQECLDAFKTGKVAMAMDYFAFFPGLLDPAESQYAESTGFFPVPAGPKGHYISIGGQGMSISAYSKNVDAAKEYMKWFIQKPVQEKWAEMGGLTPYDEVLKSEAFLRATRYNKAFSDSFPHLRDFWAVPEYAELLQECQTTWNSVLTGQMEAQAAMDALAEKHEAIFEAAGYYQ